MYYQLTYRHRGHVESCRQRRRFRKRENHHPTFGFHLFVSLHTEKQTSYLRLYKAVLKNVFHYNDRNMWSRGEIDWLVERCGQVRLMVDCHPHVPFCPATLEREKNRVFVLEKSRHIHGSVELVSSENKGLSCT